MCLPELTTLQHFSKNKKFDSTHSTDAENEKFVDVFTNFGEFLLKTDTLDVL